MSTNAPPARRRVTIVELLVVAVLAAILAAILIPLLTNNGDDSALRKDLRDVQDAVRRYNSDTQAYPTLPIVPRPDATPVNPWNPGALPSVNSIPAFAGIDFAAGAIRLGTEQQVRFFPDYLKERPVHSGETAADGTSRWRLDGQGNVHVEMDGRTY